MFLPNLLQPPFQPPVFIRNQPDGFVVFARLRSNRRPKRTGDEGRLPGKELALQHQQGQLHPAGIQLGFLSLPGRWQGQGMYLLALKKQ